MTSSITHTNPCIMINSDNSIHQLTRPASRRTLLRTRLYFHDWVSGAKTSDDQLEPFGLVGLITSHVPPQHLAAHTVHAFPQAQID